MASSSQAAPLCCGAPMRNVTESDERMLGILAWLCDRCKFERQTLEDYAPAEPIDCPRMQGGVRRGGRTRDRDPRLFGIRRKSRRWEVRVAGGRCGVWIYVGLVVSLDEAIRLRDQAK